ncbi:BT_3928 family protein [Proteiniphilum sp. X52]|uniref:BT_3928 family protein n=1 Tax=Proteiniphilum sp. X52 TaxID=2382159 RepID=UPI000F0A4752|nr:BT_3928 family protein [Proteiniphilum sp. X52]RNC63477.1 DoxX family protein [Proteiniphilum sp. X52]
MSSKTKIVKLLLELSRIIVGTTFVFSGFVKAVDPLGFTYKIEDYLIELGLTGIFPLALPAAVFMVTAEFALGVFLLLGIYRKWSARLITLFMVFFTPLTLWIAIANPVEDCGCFGDAITITNWQTFYKNVILLAGAMLLLLKWRQITPLLSKKMAPVAGLLTLLLGVLFSLHNIYRLPVIDFRPYKIGSNIPRQMFVDPEKADVLETVFIYRKEGIEKEFTEENYPWNDSTWTLVDMKTKVVKEGEKPAIEDFAVEALYCDEAAGSWGIGGDITDIILSEPSYTFLMVAYSLDKMSLRHLERFRQVRRYAEEKGYPFYFLTSSPTDVVGEWEQHHRTGFQFCHADERVLKTMIRANPGLMLLKQGTVINKWDDSRVPGRRWLDDNMGE